jgi:hypothetical protein
MPILNLITEDAGLASINPTFIYVDTNDTVSKVTTPGYLNISATNGFNISNKKMALVTTIASPGAQPSTNLYSITLSNEIVTLTAIAGGSVSFPITTSQGGTSLTSLTPYSLITGGTTSTGAMQQVPSLGTSGQFLMSNGAASLPSWENAGGVNAGTINDLAWYAASGSTLSSLPTVNSAGLLTTTGGVPQWVTYTGSGFPVLNTSPYLATPNLGDATASTLIFSPTTAGIIGVTDGSDADVIYVGAFIESHIPSPSSRPYTSATPEDLTFISLDAGDWDIFANVSLSTVGGFITEMDVGINQVGNVLPDQSRVASSTFPDSTVTSAGLVAPSVRLSLTGGVTAVHIVLAAIGTGSLSMCGGIYARRVR